MIELKSTGWFDIRDRGWVAVVENPGLDNSRPLSGQTVSIDGVEYVARGIETFCVADDHRPSKDHSASS